MPEHTTPEPQTQTTERQAHVPTIYALLTPDRATFYPLDLPYADQLSLLGGGAANCWQALMLPLQATEALLAWTYRMEDEQIVFGERQFLAWTDMPPEVSLGPWYTPQDETIHAQSLTGRLKAHETHAALALRPMTLRVTLTSKGLHLSDHQAELAPYREALSALLLYYVDALPDEPDAQHPAYQKARLLLGKRDFPALAQLALTSLLCEDITLIPLNSPEHADLEYAQTFKKDLRRQKLTRLDLIVTVTLAAPHHLYATIEYDAFVIGKHHFENNQWATEIDADSYHQLLRSAEGSHWSPSTGKMIEVRNGLVETRNRRMGIHLLGEES